MKLLSSKAKMKALNPRTRNGTIFKAGVNGFEILFMVFAYRTWRLRARLQYLLLLLLLISPQRCTNAHSGFHLCVHANNSVPFTFPALVILLYRAEHHCARIHRRVAIFHAVCWVFLLIGV